ncbi:MAG: hypothetical protein Q4G16_07850 [Cruoricaptor ignavus]|nr:hypothetical protein [Cruoricaptor ignavus]
MKVFTAFILSFIVFTASFQNSLLFLDYQIHKDFYELYCINKDKPELACHGKCEAQKDSEQSSSSLNILKAGSFDFNFIQMPCVALNEACTELIINNQTDFKTFRNILPNGFLEVIAPPPKI